MKKILFLVILLFTFQPNVITHDPHKLDSLQELLNTAKPDTSRAKILNELSKIYTSINLDTAMEYAKQGLSLSERIGYKKGMVKAFWIMGIIDTYNGKNLQALDPLKKEIGRAHV